MTAAPVSLVYLFIALQTVVVLFILLHDWVPVGTLNDVRSVQGADSTRRLITVTLASALPFGVGLMGSIYYAHSHFPGWLWWVLWLSYIGAVYGLMRAWWVPYLFVPNPERAARYQGMFSQTHSFLPMRNGITPNTLHVTLHLVIVAIVILLAVMTFGF